METGLADRLLRVSLLAVTPWCQISQSLNCEESTFLVPSGLVDWTAQTNWGRTHDLHHSSGRWHVELMWSLYWIYSLHFKKVYFIYLKKCQREKEKEIICLLIHCPSDYDGWGWARNPEICLVSHVSGSGPNTWVISCWSPRCLSREPAEK